ncbi:MAG: electron transfer flavoprotein subunit beta/FixA family protein [Chloroflexota bacterium]
MDVLVCIKRVPAPGSKIILTDDELMINTKNLGFAISPHEECAVEEAVQIKETHGGETTVLTLGADVSIEQLRGALAMGIDNAVLLETDGQDWEPIPTANAILKSIADQKENGRIFDAYLFGNESADSGGYQVGVRIAHALDIPCVTGIKSIELADGKAIAKREAIGGGWEIYEVDLPAVFTVKEGINLPRYPSLPGRMRAKKKPIETSTPEVVGGGLEKVRLKSPVEQGSDVEILGHGTEAAEKVAELIREMGLFS